MIEILIAATLTAQASPPPQPAAPGLRSGLEPIAFLVGHCWRGEFPEGRGVDTHCFEPVYGGQHVRDRHEVTSARGTYAGETFYSANPDGGVDFVYFNSLGGVSRGTMRGEPGRLDFGAESYRGADGREIELLVSWHRVGEDGYRVVTRSEDMPSANGEILYRRLPAVSMSESRDADGSHILTHEAMIGAPIAEVWDAIATPEGWRTWAVPTAWTPPGEPDIIETSYSPGASPGDPSTIRQRILAAVPGRLIAFRTVKAPEGFPHFEIFRLTTGLIELEAVGESATRVTVTGVGYPDTEAGRQLLGFFREGNRISLERMVRRFTEGPLDWSQVLRETSVSH